MKNYFKIVLFVVITFGMFSLVSCKDEDVNMNENNAGKQSNILIDECFLVRGDRGELIDLHISRGQDNKICITTSLSDIKSTDEYIPECVVIANDIEILENTIVLPETKENYWAFEVTLGDLNNLKAAPGGETMTLECHCMAQSGNCKFSLQWFAPNIVAASCLSSVDSPCSQSGVTQDCQFTTPTITIQAKSETSEKTTRLIIESNMIEYNGLLYK